MAKRKGKKWIQKAEDEMEKRGTKGSYGHHSEKQMDKDIAKGGKRGKKALFAKNMREIGKRHKKHGSGKRTRKG